MLQPKKPNPSQKTKKLISNKSSKTPSYEVDWDMVRKVNDNPAMQLAKVFDPTGISSYPDVYYATKDLAEGHGSWGELGLNLLGALPMVGKAKIGLKLAKARNASKAVKETEKVFRVIEKVAEKTNKITNFPINKLKPLATSNKIVPKVIGKTAEATEKVAKFLGKPLTPKNKLYTTKTITGSEIKNAAVDLLDIANAGADVQAVVKSVTKEESTSKEELTPKKTVYYNTNPKQGEVETPGTDKNITYLPVSNSAELKMWKNQKLAFGTPEKGIGPKRKLFDESSLSSQGFADVGFNTSSDNFNLNGGVGFNPENLYGRVGGSFNKKGFNASGNFTQRPEGEYSFDTNVGYGNDNINASLGYSKVNDTDSVTGNVEIGEDKLKFLMDFLSNKEEQNFNANLLHQDEVQGLSGKTLGTLDTILGMSSYGGDPAFSAGLGFTTKGYQNGEGFNFNTKGSYSQEEGPSINAGVKYRFANGTNTEGIMKSKMNPRKKYANGTASVGASNYIQTPAETMNDYNIMIAKAGEKAMSNPWLPVVSVVGGLMQQAAGQASKFKKVPAANGMNDVQEDVEVEGGEMYETPQGQVGEFEGPSHEQGGIPLEVGQDVQEGTKVYSDRLKVGDKTLAERKATRERQIANLEKQATKPNVDQAIKNALQRKMIAIQDQEDRDLQFQEQVNNMQAMADAAVQTFCMGTGAGGVKKYADGTPPAGIVYGKGYNADMFKDFYAKYNELNPGGVMDMKYIQGDLGMDPKTQNFGKVFGPGTYKAAQAWLEANKNKVPDMYVNPFVAPENPTVSTSYQPFNKTYTIQDSSLLTPAIPSPSVVLEGDTSKPGWKLRQTKQQIANDKVTSDNMYKGEAVSSAALSPSLTGTPLKTTNKGLLEDLQPWDPTYTYVKTEAPEKEPSGFSKVLSKLGEDAPNVGDITKLIGNYMGMTAGMKSAYEQRGSDVTQKNAFANAGKKAQELLDRSMQNIESQKAQALIDNTTSNRTAKKSARNSARGANQMTAINWLYDTAANKAATDIVNNTQSQIAQIFQQKAATSLNADQMIGTGQYQADMANMASKDAFSTALAQSRKDFATGLQQTGKDLNSMKTNKILENLLKSSGDLVGMTNDGQFYAKPSKPSSKKTTSSTNNADLLKKLKTVLSEEELKSLNLI